MTKRETLSLIEKSLTKIKDLQRFAGIPEDDKDDVIIELERAFFNLSQKNGVKQLKELKWPEMNGYKRIWEHYSPGLSEFPRDTKKFISLITKTRKRFSDEGKEYTIEKSCAFFEYCVNYVKVSSHFCYGKSIPVFDQKYLEIIKEIREGRPQKPKQAPSSQFGSFSNLH